MTREKGRLRLRKFGKKVGKKLIERNYYMNNFNWFKAIGFGVLVWLVMFAAISAVVGFGVTVGLGWEISLAVLTGLLAYIAAFYANAHNSLQALAYGVVFAVIGLGLDYLISFRFQSALYSMWTYWLGYVLVFFAPFVEFELQGDNGHPSPV